MAAVRPLLAVVDDEESVRRALARMLSASQFEVDVFASGQEFLDSLRARLPDCVILDYQMPGLTGRDVQRQLALSFGSDQVVPRAGGWCEAAGIIAAALSGSIRRAKN